MHAANGDKMTASNPSDVQDFIRLNTALVAPPLVPEVCLHLATEVVPLWRKTEEELEAMGLPPPYWAFAWAGGQALARYVLDNPDEVAGKRVLDFGAGSGLVGIAAMKAGAASVLAADIDALSAAAIGLNARANAVTLDVTTNDLLCSDGRVLRSTHSPPGPSDRPPPQGRKGGDANALRWHTILVGDMFYERPLAERLCAWLAPLARAGARVLLGDPGRSYFPKSGLEKLATYRVRTTRELEDRDIRETAVYALG